LRKRYSDTSVVSYLEGMLKTNYSDEVSKMIDTHLNSSIDWLAEHGPRSTDEY
jgi:hypothetical protein